MADKTVKVDIIASDKGTLDPLIKKSEVLRKNLNEAASGSSGRTPTPVAAARREVSAGRANADASNLTRSIGPGTGAEGRDFAKQARGMGGVVQLYATFAANIFAASAAFTALSKAADLDNLRKGLDQLGAASGRNLGSLAKDLQVATDGAISLEDALRATANASAGGLAAKDILRLGNVARQASQALGVAMPDAISRLTRGITKLEPELLDEIGIMVRLDDATRAYATSIGKSSTALTDFERRQAFANAVLEQGEKKFGAIELTVNPYAKMLASIQTLAVEVGGVINTVLSPILSLLNSSPVALATAIGGLATLLLRQAIPALSMWKANLEAADAAARKMAIETARARSKSAAIFAENKFLEPIEKSTKQLKTSADEATKSIEKMRTASNRAITPTTKKLLPDDLKDVTQEKIDALEKQARLREAASAKLKTPIGAANAQLEAEEIRRLNTQLQLNLNARTNLEKQEAKNERWIVRKTESLRQYLSLEKQQERIADRAAAKSQRISIVNAAVQDAPEKGFVQSFKDMNANIAKARGGFGIDGKAFDEGTKKMTAFNAGVTRVTGTLRLAASAAGTLLSSLGALFFYIGIAVAAFQVLNKWFSSSAKEAEKFNAAVDSIGSSVDNVSATLDNIRGKDLVDQSSINSTIAMSNAMSSLTEAVNTSVRAFENLQKAESAWDRLVDGIIDLLPFIDSASEKLSQGLANAVASSFEALENPALREKARQRLQSILGADIDLENAKEVQKYLDSLADPALAKSGKELAAALKEVDKESQQIASGLKSGQEALKALADEVKSSNAKLTPTDPFSKMGISAYSAGKEITAALQDPINALNMLKETSKNLEALSILPPNTAKDLALSSKELDRLSGELDAVRKKIRDAENDSKNTGISSDGFQAKAFEKKAAELRMQEATALNNINSKIKEFANVGAAFVEKGNALLLRGLDQSLREAALIISKGISSILKNLGVDTNAQDLSNIKEEAELQKALIDSQYANSNALADLTLTMEESNLLAKRKELQETQNKTPEQRALVTTLSNTIAGMAKAKEIMGSADGFNRAKTLGSQGSDPSVGVTEVDKAASAILQDWMQRNAGRTAQLAKISATVVVKELQNKLDVIARSYKDTIDGINATNPGLDAKLGSAKQDVSAVGEYSEVLALRVRELEVAKGLNAFTVEQLNLVSKYNQLQAVIEDKSTGAEARASAQIEQERLRNQLLLNASVYTEKQATDEREYLAARLTGLQALTDAENDRIQAQTERERTGESAGLDLLMSRIDAQASLNRVAADTVATIKAEVDSKKESLALSTRLDAAEIARNRKVAALENKRKTVTPGGEADKDLVNQIARVRKEYAGQVALEKELSDFRQQAIEDTKSQALEQGLLNEKLAQQAGIVESLEGAFGDLGSAIGSVAQVLFDFAQKNKDLNSQEQAAKDAKTTEEEKFAVAAEYSEKRKDLELDFGIAAANSSKKLFKEKTVAYKALDAIEKFMHVQKLVRNVQEMASNAAKDSTGIAGSMARGLADGAAAVAKTLASVPFPLNVAAAAAVAAIVKNLFGKGPSVSTVGYSAEERQETQGTGMSWVNGKKVENGGGVFGDAEAKSESIANSIELLNKNNIKGLSYSSKMVELLTSINRAIGGAAQSLYGIEGVRLGSAFGNKDVSTGKSGISGLFGSSTTKEIVDSGIKLEGTFLDLANGVNSAVQVYETIKKTRKKSGFLGIGKSTKVSFKDTFKDLGSLDPQAEREITEVFSNALGLMQELGSELGYSATKITSELSKINIDLPVSLRDLKGEELEKEINSIFSSVLDTATNSIFGNLKQYAKFGEGMLETTMRVVDTNDKIKDALFSIGAADFSSTIEKSTEEAIATEKRKAEKRSKGLMGIGLGLIDVFRRRVTETAKSYEQRVTEASIAITESLAELAGGLDKFIEKIEFFSNNFLTESQRLEPVKQRLTENLDELGFDSSMLDTREEFAAIVQAIDVTTESGRYLFNSMMDIAEAFAMVYPETRKSLSVEALREAQIKQLIDIMKLEGRTSEAIAKQREEELSKLDEALVPGQKYIWQLQDRLDLLSREAAVISALGFSYEALMITRALELRALTDEQRVLTELVYAAQDAAKTQDLYVRLLNASGQVQEANNITRQKELNALSDSDAALLSRIYLLEDERVLLEARSEQEKKIYELVGKAEEALALTREKELAALDEKLIPSQLYIYALEDEATLKEQLLSAYEDEGSQLRDLISRTKSFITTLKEAKDALLLGDLTILTPAQKYEESKRQAQEVAAIAMGIATTDAEKEAKDAAIEKLPTVTSQFLEASRTLYASSSAYTQDFEYVFSILENTGSALEQQLTEAEQQLAVLEANTTILSLIDTNTKTTAQLLQELVPIQERVALAQESAALAGSVAAGGVATSIAIDQLVKESLPSLAEAMFNSAIEALSSPSLGFEAPDLNIQELIVTNNNNTDALLAQLIVIEQQLEALRKEQVEQTGHVVEATVSSSTIITEAVNDSTATFVKSDFFNIPREFGA